MISIFEVFIVIRFTSIDKLVEDYIFREFRYVITIISLIFLEILYNLYFDIDYIISLINRKFLLEAFLDAIIKRISIFITIKGIDNKKYNASEYIRLKI